MEQKSIPIAVPISEPSLNGTNGTLYVNSKIKTFYVRSGIDTGKWYHGTIKEIYPNNKCSIEYDDGFTVEGGADCVYLVENNLVEVHPIIEGQVLKKKEEGERERERRRYNVFKFSCFN